MAIRIDEKTKAMLQRHAERTAYADLLIRSGDEVAGGEVFDAEWLARQQELVETFLPLVTQLVRAGLLTAEVRMTEEIEVEEGKSVVVGGRGSRAYINGQIVILAQECDHQ